MTTKHAPQRPLEDRRKAILFCPECGHASAARGDWIVDELDERTAYECPECGTTVTTRPSSQYP